LRLVAGGEASQLILDASGILDLGHRPMRWTLPVVGIELARSGLQPVLDRWKQ
jgi:hypothetical protein